MSHRRPTRLPPALLELFENSGVAWSVERCRRHDMLRVEGVAVQTLPRGRSWESGGSHAANAVAAVRRHLRAIGRLP